MRPHFSFFVYLSLSVCPLVILHVRIFGSMPFRFLFKYLPVSVSLSLFVCLAATLLLSLYLLSVFTVIVSFNFVNIIFIFMNHHSPSFISFFHPSIGGEFKTWSSSCMVYLYPFVVWVSRLR